MTSLDWLIYGIFVAMFAFAAWRLPRLWKGEVDPAHGVPIGWSPIGWSAAVRASVAGFLVWLTGVVGVPLVLLSPEPDDGTFARPAGVVIPVLVAFSLCGLAMATVALFNRPRRIVPPHLREAPGAVTQWRTTRRHKG
jgi:hypothetical protein